jgi:hypothetical protein
MKKTLKWFLKLYPTWQLIVLFIVFLAVAAPFKYLGLLSEPVEDVKHSEPEKVRQLSPEEKRLGPRPYGQANVMTFLQYNLKDSDSLKDLECGNLLAGVNAWEITCQYRAKNSFGAYVVERHNFLIHKDSVISFE